MIKNWLFKLKLLFPRWKLVNLRKYNLVSRDELIFRLSKKQYDTVKSLFKQRNEDFSYEFIPTGIGNIVKIKGLKTGEIIDITDYNSW